MGGPAGRRRWGRKKHSTVQGRAGSGWAFGWWRHRRASWGRRQLGVREEHSEYVLSPRPPLDLARCQPGKGGWGSDPCGGRRMR